MAIIHEKWAALEALKSQWKKYRFDELQGNWQRDGAQEARDDWGGNLPFVLQESVRVGGWVQGDPRGRCRGGIWAP